MGRERHKLMASADNNGPLSGHVEIDETFVGGKLRGLRGRGAKGAMKNKTVVFGMLQRDGALRAGPVPDTRRETLVPIILQNAQRGSKISTDAANAYDALK